MELSKNSKLTKLYLWFYDEEEYFLPSNLCPYFWSIVGMLLCIIPYTILCLPGIIINSTKNGNVPRFGASVVIYLVIFITICLLTPLYAYIGNIHYPTKTIGGFLSFMGIMLYGVISFILIIWSMTSIFKKENIVKKQNILVEFVKAKYNRYCPHIDWK